MPRNRKLFLHHHVHFITFRTESGLPLVAHGYMKLILRSILARAAALYPVTIGDFIVMGNHIHMMVLVEDPTIVDQFTRYFKTESAIAINLLLGRRKHTVWEEGYDSPVILDLRALRDKIAYIYSNPQKASLVNTIEEYPNLSSFEAFKAGRKVYSAARVRRVDIPSIPEGSLALSEIRYYTKLLSKRSRKGKKVKLRINPRAIFEALNFDGCSYEEYQDSVLSDIRQREDSYRVGRESVLGATALKSQSIHKHYVPRSYGGKKMIVISSDRVLRKNFITAFKGWCLLAAEASYEWMRGNFVPFPPGFFPPGGRPMSAMLAAEFY